jgi:hypothetical protein
MIIMILKKIIKINILKLDIHLFNNQFLKIIIPLSIIKDVSINRIKKKKFNHSLLIKNNTNKIPLLHKIALFKKIQSPTKSKNNTFNLSHLQPNKNPFTVCNS